MENKNYLEILKKKFPNEISVNEDKSGELYVNSACLVEMLTILKEEGLSFLADISSADYKEYFEVVYQLFSYTNPDHLTVKVKLEHEKPQVNSVTSLWPTANWLEREVYDLMGIEFLSHPNLERILTWEGFEGHPLRKDYKSISGRK